MYEVNDMEKYITVVFEYEQGASLPKELFKAFATEDRVYKDTQITGVSTEDEFVRVENLEAQLNGESE